jgi:hypothetical protein
MEKVPDAKTLVRLGQAIGPETIEFMYSSALSPQSLTFVHGIAQ